MLVSVLFHTSSVVYAGQLKETGCENKYIPLVAENSSSWPVAKAVGTNYFNSIDAIKFVEERVCQLYSIDTRYESWGMMPRSSTLRSYILCSYCIDRLENDFNLQLKRKREGRKYDRDVEASATEICSQQRGL